MTLFKVLSITAARIRVDNDRLWTDIRFPQRETEPKFALQLEMDSGRDDCREILFRGFQSFDDDLDRWDGPWWQGSDEKHSASVTRLPM